MDHETQFATQDQKSSTCPHCGNIIADGQKFCPSCGQLIAPAKPTPAAFCTHCGAELQAGQAICTKCGCPTQFAKKPAPAKPQQPVHREKFCFTKGDAVLYLLTILFVLVCMLMPGWFRYYEQKAKVETTIIYDVEIPTDVKATPIFHTVGFWGFGEGSSSPATFVLFAIVFLFLLCEIILVLAEFVKEKPLRAVHPILATTALVFTLAASTIGKYSFYYLKVSGYNSLLKEFVQYGLAYYLTVLLFIFLIVQSFLHVADKHIFKG